MLALIIGQSHPQNQSACASELASRDRLFWGEGESLARETGQSLHRLVCPVQLAKHLVKGHTIGTTIGYRKGTHNLP